MSYVVLAPFCCYDSRDWPANHWAELARRLADKGIGVEVVGSTRQKRQLERTFGPTTARWHYGQSPQYVTDLIRKSACVVANDSGIAHLGGLMGVPTVSVHGGSLPHDFLFQCSPSVSSVTANQATGRSDHAPHLLHSITVDRVLAEVLKRMGVPQHDTIVMPSFTGVLHG